MGPMLLLVVAIISCFGFSIYHLSESQRFEVISDVKSGGVFILDRKTLGINYCTEQTCKLVGNGSLPSQAVGNPAVLAAMQNSIMGAPAPVMAKKTEGAAPQGMQANLAASGVPAQPTTDNAAKTETPDTKSENTKEANSSNDIEEKSDEEFDFN